jgi:hypothetical protein
MRGSTGPRICCDPSWPVFVQKLTLGAPGNLLAGKSAANGILKATIRPSLAEQTDALGILALIRDNECLGKPPLARGGLLAQGKLVNGPREELPGYCRSGEVRSAALTR